MRIVLISTYDSGHQPFGLASPVTWLLAEGFEVRTFDLAVEKLEHDAVRGADFVGLYLPMHTATRIAVPVISAVRQRNPTAHICAYGLYAPMNAKYLQRLGVDSVIGGEFEVEIVRIAKQVAGNGSSDANETREEVVSLRKQSFKVPTRRGLPELAKYAFLTMLDGSRRTVGYTEATRGCKHLCRHCPIVPVYNGRFMVVQGDVVIDDIEQQIQAGAKHITFGDPDFFNGVGHATRIVSTLHENWPDLTYDVTIKVEHLVKHAEHLKTLKDTGCLFVTSAAESVDDDILEKLDKGHTRRDFFRAVELCRNVDLGLNPTFVAFTPWISLAGYRDLLQTILELDLVDAVASVQLAIRLLIPEGSRLLELPDVIALTTEFDEERLCYPWRHADARVDELQATVEAIVEEAGRFDLPRATIFERIWQETVGAMGERDQMRIDRSSQSSRALPYLSENWYCCAEPTKQQMEVFI